MASAELLTSGFVKVRQDLNVVETFSVLVGKLQVDVMEHQQDVFITPGNKCGLLNIKRTTGNWKVERRFLNGWDLPRPGPGHSSAGSHNPVRCG